VTTRKTTTQSPARKSAPLKTAARKTTLHRSAAVKTAAGKSPRKGASAGNAGATQAALASEHILAIDVGGTGLKASIIDGQGQMKTERVRVDTPHPCTPDQLVDTLFKLVEPLVQQLPPSKISIGFPGVVRNNRILTAPHFGVEGWHDIPLADSLAKRLGGLPVRMINDAEMQGFAAIEGHGLEFVLTLGTGAGTAMFRDGELMPHLELAHHPVSKNRAYDEYVGNEAREKAGNKRWNKRVEKVIGILQSLVNYDKLWIGGGNAARLTFELPPNVAVVSNDAGIEGGAKLWHPRSVRETRQLPEFAHHGGHAKRSG
jgi:polyphosphate glucokinase